MAINQMYGYFDPGKCKACFGEGGTFDGGHWYTCQWCKFPQPDPRVDAGTTTALPGTSPKKEAVKHPAHYNQIGGIECIDVVQHMGFNLGNAVKYIWRADLKNDAIEDMKKAIQYLEFEIEKRCKKSPSKN